MSNPNDAGLDLHTTVSADIAPMCRAKLPTGLAISIPVGMYGRIEGRSKLANAFGIDTMGRIVDPGYRGEVMVSLIMGTKQSSSVQGIK